MPESTSFAATVKDWEEQLAAIEQHGAGIPHLELHRQKLQSLLDQIQVAAATQAALTASRLEATRQVTAMLSQGRKVSTVLRTLIREHCGDRSDLLAGFGLRPRSQRASAGEGSLRLPG